MRLLFLLGILVLAALGETRIEPWQIEEDVRAFVAKNYPDIKIVSLPVPQKSLAVPDGTIRRVVEVKNQTPVHLYLEYKIYSGEKLFETVSLTAGIKTVYRVVAAKRAIPKGKILEVEDVTLKEYAAVSPRDYAQDLDSVLGRVAKNTIPEGRLLKDYLLAPDFKVRTRKSVKIIHERDGFRIEMMGMALQNGALGDMVKVKNVSSGKVLSCKVIGENTVFFGER